MSNSLTERNSLDLIDCMKRYVNGTYAYAYYIYNIVAARKTIFYWICIIFILYYSFYINYIALVRMQ